MRTNGTKEKKQKRHKKLYKLYGSKTLSYTIFKVIPIYFCMLNSSVGAGAGVGTRDVKNFPEPEPH
jgi:hypothetical protein